MVNIIFDIDKNSEVMLQSICIITVKVYYIVVTILYYYTNHERRSFSNHLRSSSFVNFPNLEKYSSITCLTSLCAAITIIIIQSVLHIEIATAYCNTCRYDIIIVDNFLMPIEYCIVSCFQSVCMSTCLSVCRHALICHVCLLNYS